MTPTPVDLSSEITTLQSVAASLTTKLTTSGGVLVNKSDAEQIGAVVVELGSLADIATEASPNIAIDPEAPPVYGPDGREETP